jgi:hypothetical protein
MAMNITLLLEKIHGHVALLTIALLLHPAVSLRAQRPLRRATRWSCYLGTIGALLTNAIGWAIYPDYRVALKSAIYALGTLYGDLFELKEHLAWYSLLLALAGGALTTQARSGRSPLNRALRLTYILSAVLMIVAASIGIALATLRGFGSVP